MKRQRGQLNIVRGFLTFSLLLLVLAIGFVVGRLMVARTYAEAAPELERLPVAEPEVAARAVEDRVVLPGSVYVPAPAPPEQVPEEAVGGVIGGEASAEAEGEEGPSQAAADGLRAAVEAEPEEIEAGGVVAPVMPAETAEPGRIRYSIQVGVFTMREGARQVAEELSRVGYPAQIEVTTAEDQSLYRVLTGRYYTEYAARKALSELEKEGYSGFLVKR